MYKKLAVLMILAISVIVSLSGVAKIKTIPMTFENPGSKRLLKSDAGNYYYFRSLPEKAMKLNVKNLESIQVRSFATKSISKPQFTILIGKQKQVYQLVADKTVNNYTVYRTVDVTIPKGTETLELLCYDRSMYFRSFYTVLPKPKVVKLPSLKVLAHGGLMTLTHETKTSQYYTLDTDHNMKFEINNGRKAVVYVRAKLIDRSIPTIDLYQNGQMVKRYQLSTKRTSKYKIAGISHLSTGLKIDLPTSDANSMFELRSVSGHLILAKPVVLKK